MSRVDEALQAWERRAGRGSSVARPEAFQERSPSRFGLTDYARETRETRETNPVEEPRQTVAPAFAEPRKEGALRAHINAEVASRLVTAESNAVPLEQYRRLAAVLHDIQQQQGLKTLMFTSALPAEGKTLTTVNLALTLSESFGRRVLVIDADLRWPSIHRVLGIVNSDGLSEALQYPHRDLPILQLSPRLSILTAGRQESAPLAGLTSARMAEVIAQCAERFDWVLLDTPPVGLLPDAQPLARLTRAVVFVIAAGVTPASTVERAVTEIGADCIIGTVLNRIDERRIPSANYYYYGRSDSEDDHGRD